MTLPHVIVGDGPPTVVVVSGGNAFVSRFDDARARRDAARFARLFPTGTRLCVVGYVPDAPGEGERNVPALARSVAALLEGGCAGAVLAGISFGGLVALRVAADRPDLVSRLVLLASAYRFSTEGLARVRDQMAHLQAGNLEAMARPFLALCRRPWLNLLLRASFALRRRTSIARLNDPAFACALLQAALDESGAMAARLGDIQARTLVVAGDRDQFFDVEAMREMALTMPSVQLALFERETHFVPLERARDVAAAVTSFLDE